MQYPIIGDMISVKNLKECLKTLDDDTLICIDKFKNLAIVNPKNFEADWYISLYSEEVRYYNKEFCGQCHDEIFGHHTCIKEG